MKSLKDIEYVGWGTFGLLYIPSTLICAAVVWYYTFEGGALGARIATSAIAGMVLSGLVTAGINELLHRRNVRNYNEERKEARKSKRKKKKKK